MSEPEPVDDADAESERFEPEISDLRPDSGPRLPLWSATSFSRRLSAHQRLLRFGSTVAAIALAVALLAAVIWRPGAPPTRTTTILGAASPTAPLLSPYAPLQRHGGTTCVADVAWSPDSSAYAVVGYQGICLTDSYVPGVVDIYNAASGQLKGWFSPDGTILRAVQGGDLGALPTPVPVGRTPTPGGSRATAPIIVYHHIQWSQDGRQLALTFSILTVPPELATASDTRQDGLLLADVQGTSSTTDVLDVGASLPITRYWAVRPGGYATPSPIVLTAAPAYRWQAGGALSPATPGQGQPGPVGNPDAGPAFTIWQPGTVARLTRGSAGSHDAYLWTTGFLAWSADGTTLLETSGLSGRLQPVGLPAPDAQTLDYFQLRQAPLLPIRDSALAHILDDLSQPPLSTDFQAYTIGLTWRPDGRILAAYSDSAYGVTGAALELFDTATGQQLISLTPLGNDGSTESMGTILRWSPDGKWLLLVSGPLGSVTLWGANALPR